MLLLYLVTKRGSSLWHVKKNIKGKSKGTGHGGKERIAHNNPELFDCSALCSFLCDILLEDRLTKLSKLLSVRDHLKARFLRTLQLIPEKGEKKSLVLNACVKVMVFRVCF